MQFKSPEYFWLSIFGLTVIAGVSSKSLLKGLISGVLGLLLSTIGMDPMEGVERFMFNQPTLYNGINVTCALIGLFSMSQVLILAEKRIVERARAVKFSRLGISGSDVRRIAPTVTRSWIIGNLIGILPVRAPPSPASWATTKRAAFPSTRRSSGRARLKGSQGRRPPTTP